MVSFSDPGKQKQTCNCLWKNTNHLMLLPDQTGFHNKLNWIKFNPKYLFGTILHISNLSGIWKKLNCNTFKLWSTNVRINTEIKVLDHEIMKSSPCSVNIITFIRIQEQQINLHTTTIIIIIIEPNWNLCFALFNWYSILMH